MVLLILFGALLYLPFTVHAANGNIFNGLPVPLLGGNSDSQSSDQSASLEEYAAGLPKPQVSSGTIAQYGVDIEYMRNHMYNLQQEGQSTKQCAACHTNREEFCDKCHNYVGVSPNIEY
jgi:cytochrome c-type biogenesis protein CcmH/NrfF